MSEPVDGLRFDIYERVHLPDDVLAIEELEEMELEPHLQAQVEEDQVLLKGHLLLSGVYRPQDRGNGESQQLEHWIPVEITLPQNRVLRVEDLAVEIDNFDVDLLSTRTLNVTGVLALRGVQSESPQIPVWRDDSFTVVHQASEDRDMPEEQPREEDGLLEQRYVAAADPVQELETKMENAALADAGDAASVPELPHTSPYYAVPEARESGFWPYVYPPKPEQAFEPSDQTPFNPSVDQRPAEEVSPFPGVPDPQPLPPYTAGEWQTDTGWGDLTVRRPEPEPEPEPQPGPVPAPAIEASLAAPEEKPEMKVGLGAIPQEPPAKIASGVGLLSQLGEKGAIREAELQALRSSQEAEEAEKLASRSTTGDELEWTKLFLSKGADAQPFRRLKICIVQREETLDSIAARYNVQPREIQLRNRLSDPYLSEGQVLYIP